ncbi:lysR substrate binding domain protein, partial [Vibrio parahaemolyticus V-223/04]
CLWWRCRSNMS